MTATHEFVVPKSIPMILLIALLFSKFFFSRASYTIVARKYNSLPAFARTATSHIEYGRNLNEALI